VVPVRTGEVLRRLFESGHQDRRLATTSGLSSARFTVSTAPP
jgi:hypothetical protein